MNTSPTTQERVWAVFSHLSALAFGMGLVLPIIGWSEQRRKSKYASFHCLQALGYQSLGYTVWMLSYFALIIMLIVLFAALSAAQGTSATKDTITGLWVASFLIAILGLFALYFFLPVIAAVACAFGMDFRYPILGKRLAGYLGYDPENTEIALDEEHEERWVAAMGHFSIIIALWGILAPITVRILPGQHNLFLRFQSLQTTVYQVIVNIIFISTGVFYFVGAMVFVALAGLESGPGTPSQMSMAGFLIFGVIFLFVTVILLVLPLFHILGQWAGYRVLKGDDYHYPLIGKFTERWLTDKTLIAEDSDLRVKTLEGESA